MARQRPRARERHRAADRHRPPRAGPTSRTCRRRSGRSAAASGCGRSANAAARSPTISTSGCATNANRSGRRCIRSTWQREITRAATCATWSARASRRRAATTRSCCKLFNMESARLQAVPEFPAQARLPAAVQGVPSVATLSSPMYETFFGLHERPFDLTTESALPVPDAAPSRGAAARCATGCRRRAASRCCSATPAPARRRCCAPRSTKSAGRRTQRPADQPDADAPGVLRVHRAGLRPGRELRPVQDALPHRVPARRPRAALGRRPDDADHRRGAEPALRAARGSPAARQHRDVDGQAAQPGAGRPAGARRSAQRAVAAAAETAHHAALRS